LRYVAALALLIGPLVIFIGYVAESNGGPPFAVPLTLVGFLLSASAWLLIPGRPRRRLVGGLVSTLTLVFLPFGLGFDGLPMPALQAFAALASGGAVAGWLIARARPAGFVRDGLILVALLQVVLAFIVGAVAGGQATDRADYYFISQLNPFLDGDDFGVRHFSALLLTIVGGVVIAVGTSWLTGRRTTSSNQSQNAAMADDRGNLSGGNTLRVTLATIGTILVLIGGGLAVVGLLVGNGGVPLFYYAYVGFEGHIPQLVAFFGGILLIIVGVAMWIAAGLAPNAEQRATRAATTSEEDRARRIAAQAEQIKQWEDAYALAHGGERPPPGVVPPMFEQAGANRTNTLAILALVFAFIGSVLGIAFGHVALSQIKRTHEAGRGLAIAGLVVGYVQLGIGVLLLIVAAVITVSRG
jgi:hypothetical protein